MSALARASSRQDGQSTQVLIFLHRHDQLSPLPPAATLTNLVWVCAHAGHGRPVGAEPRARRLRGLDGRRAQPSSEARRRALAAHLAVSSASATGPSDGARGNGGLGAS